MLTSMEVGGSWLAAGGLVLGTWALAGSLLVGAEYALALALFGAGGMQAQIDRAFNLTVACWRCRFTPEDTLRGVRLVCWLVALGSLLAMTLFLAAWLARNTHGPFLMMCALVAAQVVFVVVALIIRQLLMRVMRPLSRRFIETTWIGRHLLSFWVVSASVSMLVVAASVTWLWRESDLVQALDLGSLLLPMIAVACQAPLLFLFWRSGRRGARPGRWRQVPLAVVGLMALGAALMWLGGLNASTARDVKNHGLSSKYVLHILEKASDFDSDGFPAFPVALDCAAFDPEINPLAREVPDNGIDENCDGEDSIPTLAPRHGGGVAGQSDAETPREYDYKLPHVKPDLILVTVDALRADHLGFMGYHRDTSPDLDDLAEHGLIFTAAFSQDSGTGPSMWSLAAGKTPFQTRLKPGKGFPMSLQDDEMPMAELLQKEGYVTYARLCGSMFASSKWEISRGFDDFKEVCGKARNSTAPKVLAESLKALKRLRAGKKPFFLWVHFFDPHGPYEHHEQFDFGSENIDKYDSEIRYVSDYVADIIEAAQAQGARPHYVFLGADHGENFGEHGKSQHARTLYREVTNVPLVVWGPGVVPRREDNPVALNDLHPTLLELAGTFNPDSTMESLVPWFWGDSPSEHRVVFQENSFSRPKQHVKGAIQGSYHMLWNLSTGTQELYNWREDPREQDDLFGHGLPEEEALWAALQSFLQTTELPDSLK